MSTDDSISEDVSTSGALSHGHASADGDGGKESETSLVSSEGTSASGVAVPDDRHIRASQTTGGTVENRPNITPVCNTIRSLCLSPDEAYEQGKSLPFINPSSLETLRVLVQEIQSSGETDPEIWKDCEGRWLHLFQLVEKQYQEQILNQQEQYQCQIQLIQDEIKALVQLQNRQSSGQLHTEFPSGPLSTTTQLHTEFPSEPLSTTTQIHTEFPSAPLSTTTQLHTEFPIAPLSTTTQKHTEFPSAPLSTTTQLHTEFPIAPLTTTTQLHTEFPSAPLSTTTQLHTEFPSEPLSTTTQLHTEFPPAPLSTTNSKDYILPISNECTSPQNVPSETDSLAASAHTPPPLHKSDGVTPGESVAGQATTGLSSGYGTLSAWETDMGAPPPGAPGEVEETSQGKRRHQWSSNLQEDTETTLPWQHTTSGTNQPLTTWAQRQKRRPKKGKAGQTSSQAVEYQELPLSPRDALRHSPMECTHSHDQHRPTGPASNSFPLRRSDSLMSEASGLTYWRLNEADLYYALPDSFDPGAYLLLQDASMSLTAPPESRLSLREIYHNKQKTDTKRTDWEGSPTSSPLSPQVLTLDSTVPVRQSDRTSGFTSPSPFSSPSFPVQPHLYPRVGTPVTPDSMGPGDTDCTSSASGAAPSPTKVPNSWGNPSQAVPSASQETTQPSQPAASEEEGSHAHTSTLRLCSASGPSQAPAGSPRMERASSQEDPVVLSLLRQNLREKHSRHVADLKAYYESEIQVLRDRLNLRDLPQDLEKSNQALRQRCSYLERALAEASSCVQELEAKNISLEKKLAEWPERYAVAGATVKTLQQRLEESRRSGKDKDATVTRLKSRARQLEEAVQNACRDADEKEARREREYKMLQDLLAEYDSLRNEHKGVKDNLVSTENKLVNANEQIADLKRANSKLESQVKQLEHENQARARYASHSKTQPSGAGLFHHPDLLLSPSKRQPEPDVTRRKSPCPLTEQLNGGRKSPFPQTSQSGRHRSPCPQPDQSAGSGSSVDSTAGGSWRYSPLPECEQFQPKSQRQPRPQLQEQCQREPEGACAMTPVMRALIELEETRATQSRAPWVGSQRATVGLVERRHKEPIQERVGHDGHVAPPGGGGARCSGGPEGAAALLRAQRSLSPEGHRSSSLPPQAHRSLPPATPTKRETLLMPLSAKSSPKRSPTDNYSTAFGHITHRQQHLANRFDGLEDQRHHSFHSSSPRKRLHFTEADREDDFQQPCSVAAESSGGVNTPEDTPRPGWEDTPRPGWEDQGACSGLDLRDTGADLPPFLPDRLHSLADAERLFDELTQEKLQVEAALSRMPGAGGRVSLQTRLDEVDLENRLERLNRELGSIRMTLKRFHVLRSSANI